MICTDLAGTVHGERGREIQRAEEEEEKKFHSRFRAERNKKRNYKNPKFYHPIPINSIPCQPLSFIHQLRQISIHQKASKRSSNQKIPSASWPQSFNFLQNSQDGKSNFVKRYSRRIYLRNLYAIKIKNSERKPNFLKKINDSPQNTSSRTEPHKNMDSRPPPMFDTKHFVFSHQGPFNTEIIKKKEKMLVMILKGQQTPKNCLISELNKPKSEKRS